ncbi:hypothetical protein FNV43_RR15452 [Rhamnella rubrinervis]|uniref:Uncharacterized protein n=1 Tax=Rhamnella rubrinervis TaxID=2594499 RepID=A0A8K0GXG2_9ROSA|nr:hypothetical protein FNV43_RR15452 [Rhamnella rubrinervis]
MKAEFKFVEESLEGALSRTLEDPLSVELGYVAWARGLRRSSGLDSLRPKHVCLYGTSAYSRLCGTSANTSCDGSREPCRETGEVQWTEFQEVATKDDVLPDHTEPCKTTKELWESLEMKYKTEDVGTKKFIVGRFLEYKMVDSKTVVSQVQEFQLILHEIHSEGMILSEAFLVAAIIEKLPPGGRTSRTTLSTRERR